jgi:hypothetical protein
MSERGRDRKKENGDRESAFGKGSQLIIDRSMAAALFK